ncbi:hypothetical protein [Ilumatobacter sp.]|uniref:hypothetical protein n=1 Tax=Ilumatobacter sp. TaxID=1967498 RepID=UPI003C640343
MIEPAVATQSIRATVSVTPLGPLAAITTGLVTIGAVMSWRSSQVPDVLATVAPGALAAGVALGLDDEGFRFIRALPTTASARLMLRLVVLLPAAMISVTMLLIARAWFFDQHAGSVSPAAVSALIGTAIAIAVCWARHRPESAAEAGAAVVVVWTLAEAYVPDIAVFRSAASAWHTDPFAVLGVAVVLTVVGSSGRTA